jgi:large subunit ribosomal protein L7/L12
MPTKEEVVEALGNLSVMQIIALTKELEQKWGVEAKPQPVVVGPQKVEQQQAVQTEFSVVLVSYPADKKMSALKAIREVTGLGLKEAKEFVEAVPKVVKEGLSKEEAATLQATLTAAGGVIEVK